MSHYGLNFSPYDLEMVMSDQETKAATFRALHERPEPFLLPNPWDAGSAKLLNDLGFEAMATTSLGVSAAHGRRVLSAADILENCREIATVTPLPVNADLEKCFADEPAEAAKAMAMAYEAGAVGASIEDSTGDRAAPIYDFDLAVERVHAAVEAAHALPTPIFLTARSENLLVGIDDMDDTIRRLQAFEAVGADALYAPGLKTLDQMRTVVDAVNKPVNVVMGGTDPGITLADLADIGVRRVSIGGAFIRVALGAFRHAAMEMRDGRFDFADKMIPIPDLFRALRDGPSS